MTLAGWKTTNWVVIVLILGIGAYLIGFYAGLWPRIISEDASALFVITLALFRLYVTQQVENLTRSATSET
jgi:membrane protein YdbS with pleckstrin-like domain